MDGVIVSSRFFVVSVSTGLVDEVERCDEVEELREARSMGGWLSFLTTARRRDGDLTRESSSSGQRSTESL